ncbi:kinase-like domain-containing protein [Mariannaea sp. PMI_226]|nr:kinase-like domain-containing protein [Mariannaea sp. PMI_226]
MESSNDGRLPVIASFAGFTHICEVSSSVGDAELEFKYTSYIVVEAESGAVWYGDLPMHRDNISLEEAIACLARVPDESIYPHFLEKDFRVLHSYYFNADEGDVHYKGPNFMAYCNKPRGTPPIGDTLLEEAKILEMLDKYPHPNIVEYIGCIVKGYKLHSIAMKKYKMTLEDRCEPEVRDSMKPLDKEACIRDISAGLEHLHQLGYAHNDINPSNIVVDENDKCIIIDFGSCMKLGSKLQELGLDGFNEEFEWHSSVHNDEYGLKKLGEWLDKM